MAIGRNCDIVGRNIAPFPPLTVAKCVYQTRGVHDVEVVLVPLRQPLVGEIIHQLLVVCKFLCDAACLCLLIASRKQTVTICVCKCRDMRTLSRKERTSTASNNRYIVAYALFWERQDACCVTRRNIHRYRYPLENILRTTKWLLLRARLVIFGRLLLAMSVLLALVGF